MKVVVALGRLLEREEPDSCDKDRVSDGESHPTVHREVHLTIGIAPVVLLADAFFTWFHYNGTSTPYLRHIAAAADRLRSCSISWADMMYPSSNHLSWSDSHFSSLSKRCLRWGHRNFCCHSLSF